MRRHFLKDIANNPAENRSPARWWDRNIWRIQAILDLPSIICYI